MKRVVDVQRNRMLFNWVRPVTVVILEGSTWATTEFPTNVKVGDLVRLDGQTKKGTYTFNPKTITFKEVI